MLKNSVAELIDSYLRQGGPSKKELSDGSALAHWAVVKRAILPQVRSQASLNQGEWSTVWSPLRNVINERGFSKIKPLPALTWWEENQRDPERFVRILGQEGLLNPKEPKDRKRGKDLLDAIGSVRANLQPVRANSRFEDLGWQFTSSAFFNPPNRIIRVALTGSQTCKITGSERTLTLNLKGRVFEDPKSPTGIKVQLLENEFFSRGCELNLKDTISKIVRLSGGGDASLTANLNLLLRDEALTGRLEVSLVSKQQGVALLSGRAVYTVRGSIGKNGELTAVATPVSVSGSKLLRVSLEKDGNLTGSVVDSAGSGKLVLPVCKDPLDWSDSRQAKVRRSR